MNYKMMGKFLSQILIVEAAFMVPAMVISICTASWAAVYGFGLSIVITAAVGLIMYVFCRHATRRFYVREGMVCVAASWIGISVFGSLPFVFSEEIPNWIDALFEIVSGFTTTGSSILGNVEALSPGILYWRSFSHWVGGMGVLVFLLALSPSGDKGKGYTMHLLRAESPGPNVNKLVPKMSTTARILYLIYVGLTVIDFVFLVLGDMPVFDAVCTALGTAGTGGFGIKNDSMAGYSPYIQNVCTIFMFLFGINFSCYYLLLIRHIKEVLKDQELWMYITIFVGSIVLISCNVRGLYGSLGETVRHAAFQVSSIMTTTGFASTDFDLWPGFSKALLLCLMFIGGCAGSTAGGLKMGRLLLVLKNLRRNIRRLLSPQRVEVVRINGTRISEEVLNNVNTYLAAYCILMVVSFLLISIDGLSMTTNVSAVVACFNNIGPGFDQVGATCNFSVYSWFSKLVLIFDMLAGRLEIFPILILFSRSTWRRK